MPWSAWVLNRHSGANAPREWENLVGMLRAVGISRKLIEKIEYAAFTIKNARTIRWLTPITDPEYCTENEALRVAKKLTWLVLTSNNAPQMTDELKTSILCDRTQGCSLFSGHDENCRVGSPDICKCALCRQEVSLDDFTRDARRDPISIQINHKIPLSRQLGGHNAQNVGWVHRRCNYIQGEQTLEETVRMLARIVTAHTEFRE